MLRLYFLFSIIPIPNRQNWLLNLNLVSFMTLWWSCILVVLRRFCYHLFSNRKKLSLLSCKSVAFFNNVIFIHTGSSHWIKTIFQERSGPTAVEGTTSQARTTYTDEHNIEQNYRHAYSTTITWNANVVTKKQLTITLFYDSCIDQSV